MSKIAANETYGGNLLRKAIDYFCHCAKSPELRRRIEKGDKTFAASEFFPAMRWLKDVNDDIYDPTYTDMLRVAFTTEFRRGKLQDLVALLSGRNFETKQYEEAIAEESFARLKKGVLAFINKTHFDRFTMILRSAGFVTADLIGAQNAVNFAYILYLRGRDEGLPPPTSNGWCAAGTPCRCSRGATRRAAPRPTSTSTSARSTRRASRSTARPSIATQLSPNFWDSLLPLELDTASSNSAYFLAYQAAQVKAGDKGFLSRDITVTDLLLNRSDVHHVYPKKHLKTQGRSRGEYNQIANFVLAQSEINIAIGDKPPEKYFAELAEQCDGGKKKYGGITNLARAEGEPARTACRYRCSTARSRTTTPSSPSGGRSWRRRSGTGSRCCDDRRPQAVCGIQGVRRCRGSARCPAHWERAANRSRSSQTANANADTQTCRVLVSVSKTAASCVRQTSARTGHKQVLIGHWSTTSAFAPGDLCLQHDASVAGRIGVSRHRWDRQPGYYVVLRPLARWRCRGIFAELFRTCHFTAEIDSVRDGIRRGLASDFDWRQFKQMHVAVPPPDEQAAIVRFLDWANGRLERAIRAKRKVIALLNEQKQAIIHRAVTRGLDPSVPLKPSGIPWLGDIPQHWEVRRLKHLTRIRLEQAWPSHGYWRASAFRLCASQESCMWLRGFNMLIATRRYHEMLVQPGEPSSALSGEPRTCHVGLRSWTRRVAGWLALHYSDLATADRLQLASATSATSFMPTCSTVYVNSRSVGESVRTSGHRQRCPSSDSFEHVPIARRLHEQRRSSQASLGQRAGRSTTPSPASNARSNSSANTAPASSPTW